MAAGRPPGSSATTTVVLMGVSGTGKSTVARNLVDRLGWRFAEGDDLHPAANVERMRAGVALDDEARAPWLSSVARWIGERESDGEDAVVTCSALRRVYRDVLRRGHPSVWFGHLSSSPDVLRARVRSRTGHFMAASLLESQLATLEPLAADEPGVEVSGDNSPDEVAAALIAALVHDRGGPGARLP